MKWIEEYWVKYKLKVITNFVDVVVNFVVIVLIEYEKRMLFSIAGYNYLPEIFICIFILSHFELYFSILYLYTYLYYVHVILFISLYKLCYK